MIAQEDSLIGLRSPILNAVHQIDLRLLYWINGDWPEWWTPIMDFFSHATEYMWVKIALGILVVVMLSRKGLPRKTMGMALLSFPLANLVTDVLKATFQVPRPFQVDPNVILRAGESSSFGTASAHSANMAAVAFAFCYFKPAWGIPWAIVALMTGLSRIYLGVHYPSQVLYGWLVGAFCAFLFIKTWEAGERLWSKRKGSVEEADVDGDESCGE